MLINAYVCSFSNQDLSEILYMLQVEVKSLKTHEIERFALIRIGLLEYKMMHKYIATLICEWCTFDEDEIICLFNYGIVKFDDANLDTRPDLWKLVTTKLVKPYPKLEYTVP
jgi:hypothetical protein